MKQPNSSTLVDFIILGDEHTREVAQQSHPEARTAPIAASLDEMENIIRPRDPKRIFVLYDGPEYGGYEPRIMQAIAQATGIEPTNRRELCNRLGPIYNGDGF